MAREPRVVAELGRPETPSETAERKAAFSAAYRSSKTTRNLIAALLATMAVVVVIVFAVPRGSAPARPAIDVAAVARTTAASYGTTVIVPETPADWLVNTAEMGGDEVRTWTVGYAPPTGGFLRVAQGFDADEAWTTRVLAGAGSDGTVVLGGIEWNRYRVNGAGNVTYAIGATAGPDRVLVYGSTSPEVADRVATQLAPQITARREEAR